VAHAGGSLKTTLKPEKCTALDRCRDCDKSGFYESIDNLERDGRRGGGPLSSFPTCMLCQQPLAHITYPILLPCTHYIVCLPCFEVGRDESGRVKCAHCDQSYSNLSKDEYITEMGYRLSTTPSEALPQTEEEEKYQLAVYLLRYKESHPTDLAQISLLPKESQRSHWDCFYCAERANDQMRCRKCKRVNLNKVEDVGLSESIAAALTQTEVIELNARGQAFRFDTRVGMGRPVLADSTKEKEPEQGSNPAVTEPIRVEEIKSY